ncbi:aminotransferase class III-fold pyridoxal phosphate-dependent enzyme [Actinosynnema sp. NPDC023587]|uniref:aspartate aminotransferase family protein n=1 Tax=Actinosynnema sp. NPDC023587 TaxID=3154695 RepID=UPI0033EFD57F
MTDDVVAELGRYQSRAWPLLFRLAGLVDVEAHADGSWVVGESGRRYLDLGSFSVFLFGHRHPKVVDAVRRQLELLPVSSRALPTRGGAAAGRALASLFPFEVKVQFLNSGAEAVEAAIRLARAGTTGPARPLAAVADGYHGRTSAASALSGLDGPHVEHVVRLPREDRDQAVDLIERTGPAAVFVEAVQGEGGARPLSDDYLVAIRAACDTTGALLVCDEIQCGLGRCGTTWAYETSGIRPDVVLVGKALGGGVVPVTALVATGAAFAPLDRDPFLCTSTFAGNPLAAAAVTATVALLDEEAVADRCRATGRALEQVLARLHADFGAAVTGHDGRGLLRSLTFARPDLAGEFLHAVLARGVLVTPCLRAPRTVRVTPSAFLTADELATAEQALRAAAAVARSVIDNESVRS